MKKIIALLVLVFVLKGHSQSVKEKIADKKFNNLEYASASPIYEELSHSKHPKTKYYVRAGECNLNSGDYLKAQVYYDKAYSNTGMTDHDLYNYYQVLKYNSNYSKATEVFDKINDNEYKMVRDNLHRKKLAIEELKKDSANYTLKTLDINSEENDFCPYVMGNEMYFLSSRRNTSLKGARYGWDNSYFLDVYKGYIDGGKVKNAEHIDEGMKTSLHEGPLCYTKDGNTQFITRSNVFHKKVHKSTKDQVNLKIFIRKKENDKWSDWTEFPFNSDEYSCGHPAVTSDGKVLYFVSDMPGTYGQSDIFVSNNSNGTWSKPENIGQHANSEGREMFPMLFEDEVLFFSSDGKVGLGGMDIFFTIHGGEGMDGYFEAQNLGYPLNSTHDDFGFFATSSSSGYFSTNRGDKKDDIMSFEAKRPIISSQVHMIVKDKESGEILPNAEVTVIDENGKPVAHLNSDDKGELKVSVLPGKNYKIKTLKEGFKESVSFLEEKEISKLAGHKKELLVEKKFYGLLGIIADAETLSPLENVKITLTDAYNSKDMLNFTTDKDGDFRHKLIGKKIGDELSVIVKMEKEGYVTKTQAVDLVIKKEGWILLHDYLNTKMYKIKLGADIGKMVDLKPIYFDLGKFNIRPDASVELDKIVTLLKENPSMTIELGSHTDCRGTAASNMALSDKRAKSSAAYVISKGIDKNRIYGKGYGESKLVNDCKCEGPVKPTCDEDTHAANRRTEFKIVKIKP
jgi:outer membrane protein OmpA-like peptidoglycan-associated protein